MKALEIKKIEGWTFDFPKDISTDCTTLPPYLIIENK